jgi:hypothetical protein
MDSTNLYFQVERPMNFKLNRSQVQLIGILLCDLLTRIYSVEALVYRVYVSVSTNS